MDCRLTEDEAFGTSSTEVPPQDEFGTYGKGIALEQVRNRRTWKKPTLSRSLWRSERHSKIHCHPEFSCQHLGELRSPRMSASGVAVFWFKHADRMATREEPWKRRNWRHCDSARCVCQSGLTSHWCKTVSRLQRQRPKTRRPETAVFASMRQWQFFCCCFLLSCVEVCFSISSLAFWRMWPFQLFTAFRDFCVMALPDPVMYPQMFIMYPFRGHFVSCFFVLFLN